MEDVVKVLTNKIMELEYVIEQARDFLARAPEGKLRIARNNNTLQYYIRTDPKDFRGRYIKKSEIKLAEDLAQKDYAEKVLTAAAAEKNSIEQFLKEYHPERVREIYEKLPQRRCSLINPYVLSDKDFIIQWEQEKYEVKYQPEEDCGIYTENNEAVRSKSEKILADKFKTMGVPYHYEKPLYLRGYGTVYPDFTVLNKCTRREYYWEHLGLMDDKDYCEKSIKKIETMAKNNILQGKNLILTFETAAHPLNIKNAERLIDEYLL